MTKNKKTESAVASKAWIEYFWKNKEDIQNDARLYEKVKWYKAPRYLAAIIISIQMLAGFAVGMLNIIDFFAAMTMFAPLIYLLTRGYRPFIAFTLLFYTIDKLYTMYMIGNLSIPAVCWWAATTYFLIMAFRIEQEKVRLNVDIQKTYIRDSLIFVILFAVFFVLAATFPKPQPAKELMYWKGFSYRNTEGINKYCNGVDMSAYNEKFANKNEKSLISVDEQILALGFNPQTIFADLKIPQEIMDGQVAYYFETFRKGLISFVVVGQSAVTPQEFVWKDEFWDIMPRDEFCKFINNNFELFENLDGDFAKFSQFRAD